MRHRDVVIIGGGPAGRVIIHTLHHADARRSVTLIKDEPINVNRCAVPYGIAPDRVLEQYMIPNALVTDFGAELLVDRVERIDPAANTVTLVSGETISYGDLVLATGSRPLLPSIRGVEAGNVTPVRSRDDLVRLRELASKARRAVVVGGGYIGVEVAVVLRQLGLDVTIVEMLPHVVQQTAEPELIEPIEADLTDHGIHLALGRKVTEFLVDDGVARGVRLDDGTTIDTDLAVVSVGVVPNVELAEEAGLETSRFGIVTDEHLRTSVPNIYASGDCAAKKSFVTGQPVRGEFGTNAVFMSKVVAANILGNRQRFPGVINANGSATFDYSFGGAGLTAAAAREAGLDVVSGCSEVLDQYPMMPGVAPIRTKLVFERASGRLIGGSVLRKGFGAAANVDLMSFAIQMHATMDDLGHLQYATHPELAAKPSDNIYVFAAIDAGRTLPAASGDDRAASASTGCGGRSQVAAQP